MSEIEKQLRKELRTKKWSTARRERELFLIDTGTVETPVLRHLLQKIFNRRVRVTLLPSTTRRRKGVFLPTSLENELCRGLRNFLEDEDVHPRFPTLMATIPEAMILTYGAAHNITGKPLAPRDDVRELLEELQARQPQTKSALRKSLEWLEKKKEV